MSGGTDDPSLLVCSWDDGIILPSDTRTVLGLSLGVISKSWRPEERKQVGNFGVFRM